MSSVALDIEVYKNYFLIVAKKFDGTTYKVSKFNDETKGDIEALKAIFRHHTIITFNGTNYDLPIIGAFLKGKTNKELKLLSDTIIKSNKPWYQLSGNYDFSSPKCDHVDLMGVTPLKASLKTYMARIHAPTIQDLPIHPMKVIYPDDAKLLERYCENDVDGTLLIARTLKNELKLRVDMQAIYGFDMRSMSDPQIAEAIIRDKLTENNIQVIKRTDEVKPFHYKIPDFIGFETELLSDLLTTIKDTTFKVDDNGYVKLPKHLEQPIQFYGASYKLGIGGLHSQEKKQIVVPTAGEKYYDVDVASYYPSIILGQNLYPSHLDKTFCDIYKDIFDKRIEAKHKGNKVIADSLKIVLNSSYGKFGSKYSFLYSPELLVQTTITGQLALLMLIEQLSLNGVEVKSANTDGITILLRDITTARHICDNWTKSTSYILEWTEYVAQYSRDVNSYIAFKPDGSVKTKGCYEYGSIRKGHSNEVCIDAVIAYLKEGIKVEETIRNTTDIRKFTTMRGVTGGGMWRNTQLGKVVRWYLSTDGEPIRYIKNNNKVAGTDGAKPIMVYGDIPSDIDYDAYINKSYGMLKELSCI